MGSIVTKSTSVKGKEECPNWIYTAVVTGDPSLMQFGAMSSGLQLCGPCQVQRSRKFQNDTDAAMWKQGFTSGKHVFEIHFPVAFRGMEACVGVGLEDATLHSKGKVCIAGMNGKSWGISLRSRRAFHDGKMVRKYPQTQQYLPDKFYMYLDGDSGSIQFGCDMDFYGMAHEGMPVRDDMLLYPMIGCTVPNAQISMIYRGQATSNITMMGPPPPDASFNPYGAMPPVPPPSNDFAADAAEDKKEKEKKEKKEKEKKEKEEKEKKEKEEKEKKEKEEKEKKEKEEKEKKEKEEKEKKEKEEAEAAAAAAAAAEAPPADAPPAE